MKKYLIDTDISIYYMKGLYNLQNKFKEVGIDNCYISEISIAELKFGIENSKNKEHNRATLENYLSGLTILPIFHSLDLYAKEKVRLRKTGEIIDEFDLLIGTSAVYHKLILVTNNTAHFSRIKKINLENWSNQV